MTVYYLLAFFALKHFLASYPLQTAYTSKGLSTDNWQLPMLARAGIHGGLTAVLVFGYWSSSGRAVDAGLLAAVAFMDMASHFFIDRVKVSKDFFGNFQVASAADLAQCTKDYTSSNPAVVKAAQDLSDSSKYFWWVDGFCHLLYAGMGIYIASMVA